LIYIFPRNPMNIINTWLPDTIHEAIQSLGEGEPVFLVGGAVRDAILSEPRRDFDFVFTGSVRQKAKKIADRIGGDFYPLDENRQMMRVLWYPLPGEAITLDFSKMQGDSIEDDLLQRDFTINSMAVLTSNPDRLIDPLGGAKDLKNKILRRSKSGSILNDPVRTIRAVRLAVQFDLSIELETSSEIHQAADLLVRISTERIRDELFRILGGVKPAAAIRIMIHFGLLKSILPETLLLEGVSQSSPHTMDVMEHTLTCVDRLESILNVLSHKANDLFVSNLTNGEILAYLGDFRPMMKDHLEERVTADRTRRSLLIFAALFHDIAKPETKTTVEDGTVHFYRHEILGTKIAAERLKSLACSNDEIIAVEKIIRNHMRPNLLRKSRVKLTDRAIYRFFQSCGEEGVDVCLISMADMLAKRFGPPENDEWTNLLEINRELLDGWYNHRVDKINPPRWVDGEELMECLSIQPGPIVGEILAAITEGQAAGEINCREDAIKFALDWKKGNSERD
jgi:poly(A) polymerase